MYSDVVDLRDFYATSLGQVACRMIRRRIRQIWPDVAAARVLGLGYAVPYLRAFREEAERVVAVMPARQGVLSWPPDGPNLVALADEGELPFDDSSMDRVLLVHALESSEEVRPMLKEIWRVLAGSGRVLVIVPNRRGIWTRLDRTPFGLGHPYTPGQLSRLLREETFTPVRTGGALYIPPSASRVMLRAATAWERVGERWFTRFAGVAVVEASKQIYARAAPKQKPRRRPAYAPLPRPAISRLRPLDEPAPSRAALTIR